MLIVLLAILKFILPFLLQHPVYELHRDEFLYLEQGHHLAWGYREVPPFLSWLAWCTHALGGGFFWVKFWPSLFGAATLVITCRIVIEMGGRFFAMLLASLCILFTAYMRMHFLFQANFLEIFWWTLIFYFIIRYINTNHNKYLYLIGVAVGFAWLSKNSVLFLLAGLFVSVLLTRYRILFRNRHFYLAACIALLMALPNLIWQQLHHWPLLKHMNELRETQLKYIQPVDFLTGQVFMYLPAFFVWTSALIWFFTKPGRRYRLLGGVYFFVLLFLILSSGKAYYSMGLYALLFAAGGTAIEQWTKLRWIWLRWFHVGFLLVVSFLILPLALPVYVPEKLDAFYQRNGIAATGALKWEDQQNHSLPQDFADYLGWKELTAKTERFYQSLPILVRDSTIIFCRHYGQAGALKYYGTDTSFSNRVITDNGSFLDWIPENQAFRHILLVSRTIPDEKEPVFQHFKQFWIIDSVTNEYSRQRGDKILFYEQIDAAGYQFAIEGLKRLKE
jgi:4-amino-4-deoxy-L-arabinose transferase-like glycosyltransferase